MQDTPDGSFLAAVEPLRGALRVHCYRMLGSSHDGDDVVQEALVRAWRAKDSLHDPELLKPWLYRIATNVCLDELKRRPKRVLATDAFPKADPTMPPAAAIDEPLWLEPMPDTWLDAAGGADPAARYTLKESVALAFVAALQILSPVQRATLLLRDVVGMSAEEAATALGVGVGAVNSALHRARAAVDEKLGGRGSAAFAETAKPVDEALLERYVRAFEEVNIDALVALFHDDVRTAMPPSPAWFEGRAANETFFRRMLVGPDHLVMRAVRTRANGQSALGFYRSRPGEPLLLRAISVIGARDGKIATIDHFMTPAVFPLFGLPERYPHAINRPASPRRARADGPGSA